MNALLDALVQEAIALVDAEGGAAGPRTPEGMACKRYFQKGAVLPLDYRWPPIHGLPGWLLVHKTPYLTNDALTDPQIVRDLCVRFGVQSALSNRDAADSLKMLLEVFGYDVAVTYTGPDGVAAAVAWGLDAVVCDIGLPGLDGYGVARELRRYPAAARLIAVTGYGGEEDRVKSRQAGFDAHLTKPADPTALQDLLAGTESAA